MRGVDDDDCDDDVVIRWSLKIKGQSKNEKMDGLNQPASLKF